MIVVAFAIFLDGRRNRVPSVVFLLGSEQESGLDRFLLSLQRS